MATIRKILSTKLDSLGKGRVLLRVTVNHTTQVRLKTDIFVSHKRWSVAKERIEYGRCTSIERQELVDNTIKLKETEMKIVKLCEMYPPETLTKAWLENILRLCADIPLHQLSYKLINSLLEQQLCPKKFVKQSFFDLMEEYLADTKFSTARDKNIRVLMRALQRYEWYVRFRYKKRKDFTLDVDTMDKEIISDIESFLRHEHILHKEYPKIFKKMPSITGKRKCPKPKPRGNNTICALFTKLRAFFNWCNENKKTANRPFVGYNGVTSEKYGTPYYITLDERNHIADFDLSAYPHLAVQRDIFIFQCCVGCRVSDLMRLTATDVIDGEIQYIPHKTKGENPTTVRVPLNERARNLIAKYEHIDPQGRLFPFIASQSYNRCIREIFRKCGVTRMVTTLNPTTGEEEKRPICDVASSHMARRCFVGNLYKRWADPNVICPMSGHKLGSTAFARYREIDKELRIEVIKSIE